MTSLSSSANVPRRSDTPWVIILVVCALSPVLAFALPEHPSLVWPMVTKLVDPVVQWIPGIGHLAGISSMPETIRLFMSVQWILWGPICLGIFIFGGPTEKSMIFAMRIIQARW